jgi:hypothetical protein
MNDEPIIAELVSEQTRMLREDFASLRKVAEDALARAEEAERELELARIHIEELQSQLKEKHGR